MTVKVEGAGEVYNFVSLFCFNGPSRFMFLPFHFSQISWGELAA